MSYTNLLYHVVYATKERAPLITLDLKPRLHEYLGGIVNGLNCVPIEINGMSEHVHLLVKIRPTISVAEFLALKFKLIGLGKATDKGTLCVAGEYGAFT